MVCVDELGPVTPARFPSGSGMVAGRTPHQSASGIQPRPGQGVGLRRSAVEDGKSLTFTSRSRNSKGYLKLLEKIERAIPTGPYLPDRRQPQTHKSALVREWLEEHPRIEHAFIPKGAAWLNLIEAWWRFSGDRPWPEWTSPTDTRST